MSICLNSNNYNDNCDLDLGKIAIFYGGDSSEREVSLFTGKAIFDSLKSSQHDVTLFDIPSELNIFLKYKSDYSRVFIALHGDAGENGTIQGMLSILGIPFTGSKVLGSAVAMDKLHAKSIWKNLNLPIIDGVCIKLGSGWDEACKQIKSFGFPCVLKPVAEGSSRDVYIFKDNMLDAEVNEIISSKVRENFHKKAWMLERFIEGREFSVSIMLDKALPVIEIKPKKLFYSYEAKYLSKDTNYICPAELSDEKSLYMQEIALKAFLSLGCEHWGRVDFLMDKSDNIYLLEANTIPGMTETSLVPKAAQEIGIDFNKLVVLLLASCDRKLN